MLTFLSLARLQARYLQARLPRRLTRFVDEQAGDNTLEWVLVAVIAIAVVGVAIWGIAQSASTEGGNASSYIGGINVPSSP